MANDANAFRTKIKREPGVTPEGDSMWAFLTEADENPISGKREFKVMLALQEDSPECKQLRAEVDRLVDEAYEEVHTFLSKAKSVKVRKSAGDLSKAYPYTEEEDKETGELTGRILFKFKTAESYEDYKTGETVYNSVPLFDAANKPIEMKPGEVVGNGSRIVVAYWPKAYHMVSSNTAGTTLYLNAVQVVEMNKVTGGGGGTAEGYGFAPKATAPTPAEDEGGCGPEGCAMPDADEDGDY